RLIICPQNNEAAIVEVDAVHAALTSTFGDPDVRLQGCWRWPIHQACGQECLVQLDVAAPESLVHGVLMRWYESKACVVCGVSFGRLHLQDNEPALREPNGRLMTWNDLTPGNLHTVLANCEPVCWVCYVAASFIAATVRRENCHDSRNFSN